MAPPLRGVFQPQGIADSELSNPELGWFSPDRRCWFYGRPRISLCGRFAAVLHGTIYNHLDVRCGLRLQTWQSQSDLETLVDGLAQRGPALLLDLRGMFAFAAYDSHKEQLLLARDRLGIKSLYMSWKARSLHFSCQRGVLPDGGRLDPQLISQVLAFGHECTPTRFPGPDVQGAVSLPSGMVVRINHSRRHDPVRYWPPQPRPDWTPLPIHNARSARSFLRQQLEEILAQQLVTDRTVACMLSSGLASSALAALASRLLPDGVDTVTVALPGMPVADIDKARRTAAFCNCRHHELQITEREALAWLEQGLTSSNCPSVGGLKTWMITRAVAAHGIPIALSGVGAVHLFGSSRTFRRMVLLQMLRWLPTLSTWDRWHLRVVIQGLATDGDLVAAGAEALRWPESPPARIIQAWGKTCWLNLFLNTEPTLLRDADAAGIDCGLQLRLPYLDHRIVEIALRMPQRFQLSGDGLLFLACRDILPPGHLPRRRPSFTLPMEAWMLGPLRDHCRFRLDALRASGWLNPSWIDGQWQAFERGQIHWHRAWSLMMLGERASHLSAS